MRPGLPHYTALNHDRGSVHCWTTPSDPRAVLIETLWALVVSEERRAASSSAHSVSYAGPRSRDGFSAE